MTYTPAGPDRSRWVGAFGLILLLALAIAGMRSDPTSTTTLEEQPEPEAIPPSELMTPPDLVQSPPDLVQPPQPPGDDIDQAGAATEAAVGSSRPNWYPRALWSADTTLIVSPNGRPDASGTQEAPLDLATALDGSRAGPGDLILLSGGTYEGTFFSNLEGEPNNPITVQSAPSEWAVLDGGTNPESTLTISGSDTRWAGFEVMKSDPNRTSNQPGNKPTDNSRGTWSGVWVEAPRTQLINLVVRDNGDGIGLWRHAPNSLIYGCIIYNNGWQGRDRAWGHGVYLQSGLGRAHIEDTVIFNNFGYGLHAFSQGTAMENVRVDGLTSFENGSYGGQRQANALVGSTRLPADDISITNSFMYHRPQQNGHNIRVGLRATSPNGSVELRANHVIGGSHGIAMINFEQAVVKENVLINRRDNEQRSFFSAEVSTPGSRDWPVASYRYDWDSNTYIDRVWRENERVASFKFNNSHGADGSSRLTFREWREATGFDANSRHASAPSQPPTVLLRINRYSPDRASLTVFNPAGDSQVDIRPDELLKAGDRYAIWGIEHLSGEPVRTDTYDGSSIQLPISDGPVDGPVGFTGAVEHTPNDFGAYLLVKLPS